ncbi:MAG: pyrophosphatase [Patescibacteria group bacterium]
MNIDKLTEKIEEVSKKYTSKFKIKRDDNWYILKLQEELGELIQAFLMMKGQARAKDKTKKELKADFEAEIADVLCHVLLLAKNSKVDLEKTIADKWFVYLEQKSKK